MSDTNKSFFKNGDIIDIKTSQGNFIGKIGKHDDNKILLVDICKMVLSPDGKSLTPVPLPKDAELIFCGEMLVMIIKNEAYLNAYKQAISPIIQPIRKPIIH